MSSLLRQSVSVAGWVVVMAMVALPVSCVMSMVVLGHSVAERVKCASNLYQMGQAFNLYANGNNGHFPKTRYDATSDVVNVYTGAHAKNPFGADGPAANDVSAVLYLLLRTQSISADAFTCPSGDAVDVKFAQGTAAQGFSNFIDNLNLSYSVAVPYATEMQRAWNQTIASDFVLVADMNPGSPELMQVRAGAPDSDLRKINSPNHGGSGQNVLYADGHVEFKKTPYCGVQGDNIYTYGVSGEFADGEGPVSDHGPGLGIIGRPSHMTDSVLLPTALQGMPTEARLIVIQPLRSVSGRSLMALAGVGLVVAIAFVLRSRRKKRPGEVVGPKA